MREFGHELQSLEEVRETILASVEVLPQQRCLLEEAHGKVLRIDLVAPPFDNSAMDGYAVRVADIEAATEDAPVTLSVAGRVQAGDTADAPLESGTAIRIMTGAPLPQGTEAVVPHELTVFTDETVTFTAPIPAGKNVRYAGGDIQPGDRLLEAGTVLRAPQMSVAGVLGFAEVVVTRRPRVAILSPGNELVTVAETPGPGQIRNSNAVSLHGLVCEAGGVPMHLGIVPDTKEDILAAIHRGIEQGADAFVSTGGVSAGDFDFVQAVVREHGEPGRVFKVAMRPGKPQAFGLFDGRPFFGLPGNPAASIVSFEIFVRPALRKMRGEVDVLPEMFDVKFPFEYAYKPGRVHLLRTRIEPDPDGGLRVIQPGSQDSSFLASMATANGIVVLPADGERVAPGESRPAFWLGSYHA